MNYSACKRLPARDAVLSLTSIRESINFGQLLSIFNILWFPIGGDVDLTYNASFFIIDHSANYYASASFNVRVHKRSRLHLSKA